MSEGFSSYEEAKKYMDNMERDRIRCGDLYEAIRTLQSELDNKKTPPTQVRRTEIEEEMKVYVRVRDNMESKFPEKYGVSDVRELSKKIHQLSPDLELMKRTTYHEEVQKYTVPETTSKDVRRAFTRNSRQYTSPDEPNLPRSHTEEDDSMR